MTSQTSIIIFDKKTHVQKAQITRIGFMRWKWVVYVDPTVCKATDPHGVAPTRFLAKLQVAFAIYFRKV